MSTTEWRAKDRRACDCGGLFCPRLSIDLCACFGVGLGETRRAAWLIAAAFSAGNQIFCDDSFFKIDKMVDALLVVFPSGYENTTAPLSSKSRR